MKHLQQSLLALTSSSLVVQIQIVHKIASNFGYAHSAVCLTKYHVQLVQHLSYWVPDNAMVFIR